jgi:hypothetical protein
LRGSPEYLHNEAARQVGAFLPSESAPLGSPEEEARTSGQTS